MAKRAPLQLARFIPSRRIGRVGSRLNADLINTYRRYLRRDRALYLSAGRAVWRQFLRQLDRPEMPVFAPTRKTIDAAINA